MRGSSACIQEPLRITFRFEGLVARGLDHGFARAKVPYHAEGSLRIVGIDFPFAVDNDPHPHTLDPSCTEFGPDLLPKNGAQFKPYQAVQDASGLLGVDQISVHRSRGLNGLEDGGFCDLREHNAFGLISSQSKGLHQVPADGLSLSVLIRRQPNHFSLLGQFLEFRHHLGARRTDDVFGGKIVFNVHTLIAFGEVADVAHGRFDHKVLPEVTLDGFGLCRRLDDDKILGHGKGVRAGKIKTSQADFC